MSGTVLWGINKHWEGKEIAGYKNGYLFPVIAQDCLFLKYITSSERDNGFGYEHETVMSWYMFDKENKKFNLLNDRVNKCENQTDRIVWELSNASVMNAKDKAFVAKCVRAFAETYSNIKSAEHLYERFQKIADDIENLPDEYKFFVIQPTNSNDRVEYWFYYNDKDKKLSDWDKPVCEFTIIENEKIVGFADNLEMCKAKRMIITLCGSTKFKAEFEAKNRELTLAGHIVISVGVFVHDGKAITDKQKQELDELHKRKIDLSDAIYVINKDGYIGSSTQGEIEYAKAHGKKIMYLEEV